MIASNRESLVSVIICTYNGGAYLIDAVRSVVDQTHKALEIIVVDDGSTDGSVDALRSAISDPRLRILSQAQKGKAAALNHALSVMQGEFFAIQDADDLSAPNRIQIQVRAMHDNPDLAAVFCGHELILEDRRLAPRFRLKTRAQCLADITAFRMPAHDPTVLYRWSMVRDLAYDEELRIGQGYDYILRVGERSPMLVLGQCLYSYRVHKQSVTRKAPSQRHAFVQKVVSKACARRGINYDELVKGSQAFERNRTRFADNNLAANFIESVIDSVAVGKRRDAIRTGLQCVSLHPTNLHYYKALIYAGAPLSVVRRRRRAAPPIRSNQASAPRGPGIPMSERSLGPALSLVAFGRPSHARTFSGYSKHLGDALQRVGAWQGEYSLRSVSLADCFSGALILGRGPSGRPAPVVSRRWLWSDRGSAALQRRLIESIRQAADPGPFLQIGSLVSIPPELGRSYVLTDMTIVQAHREGFFAVSKLGPSAVKEAVEVQRRVLAGVSHTFTLTEWARRSIIEDYGVPPERVSAVYIGSNIQPPRELPPPKPKQILFVGIDWERKGGPALVKGFEVLRRRVPDAELVVVGCDPGISQPGVRCLGYLPPSDPKNRELIARLFCESRCFCMLSAFEPLGNVFVEAYACGLPIVAFDRGSRSEIVEHERSGLLCQTLEPDEVAAHIERLLTDDALHARLKSRALELAAQRFHWMSVVERVLGVVSRDAGIRDQSGGLRAEQREPQPSGAPAGERP
ncbi:MAG: glycosyltransferase [Planctomycetota bacterium]|nr:glycosyltransferase [Planctomycetota bacterium]